MAAANYKPATAYARAKRAQVVLAQRSADEFLSDGITVHALHPGWVDTPLLADNLPGFHRIMKHFLRAPNEGADTQAWLAAAPEAGQTTGSFWFDRRHRRSVYLPWTRTDATEGDKLISWMNDRITQADAVSSDSAQPGKD